MRDRGAFSRAAWGVLILLSLVAPTTAQGDLPPGAVARLGTHRFNLGPQSPTRVAWFPDSKRLATNGKAGHVVVWDEAGDRVHTLVASESTPAGKQAGIRGIAVSPDGKLVAAGVAGPSIRIWDSASGAVVRDLQISGIRFPGGPSSVAFSPDGSQIASVWAAVREGGKFQPWGHLLVWDVGSPSPVKGLSKNSFGSAWVLNLS